MRPRSLAVAAWIALLLLAVAVGPTGVQAADSPTVSVSVNDEPVSDGAWIVRPEANLSTTVRAESPIETVIVRINGEDVLEATPDAKRFDTTLEPASLDARWNSIQVVATVAGGDLQTHRFHVYEDSLAPDIALSSPVTVESGHRFPEQTNVTRANLTVNGTVTDVSEIEDFSAKISGGGQSIETTTLQNGSFLLDTTLAPGNHTLSVVATDEYGNTERQFSRFRVTDDGPPSVSLQGWPNVTEADSTRPSVVATDAVAVRSIEVRVSGQPSRTVLEPTSKLLGANRTNVTRTVPIEFYHPGNHTVTVNATDYAGQYDVATTTVTYDPETPGERAAPEITVHGNQSGIFNGTTYHLEATVANGSIQQVVLEAADNETGRVTAYERLYDAEPRSRVGISHNLSLEPGRTDVRIQVEDSLGNTHRETVTVDTETARAYGPAAEPAGTENPATATSSGTARPTRISVTEMTPLTPVSGGSAPTSPLVAVLAVVVVALLVGRRR